MDIHYLNKCHSSTNCNLCQGDVVEDDGDITVLGEIISKLPVDVQLGKLIVLGHIFGVLKEAIIIAAGFVYRIHVIIYLTT